MTSRVLLVVAGLAVLAGVGAWALLSGESDTPTSPSAAQRATETTGELPTFASDFEGAARAPQALEAPAAPEAAMGAARAPAQATAAQPAGPRRTVAGRVLRASDGTPIGGVRVANHAARVEAPEGGAATLVEATETALELVDTPTAEDGSFTIALPLGTTRLHLSTEGAYQVAELPPGDADLAGLSIVFDSGFRVAGLVLDEAGAPLPGAKVDVDRRVEAEADAAGRFLVRDVVRPPGGGAVVVQAQAPFHARGRSELLAPRDPTEMPFVELRLAGSGKLQGRVTLADGAPAAGVGVEIPFRMGLGSDSELVSGLTAGTDAEGHYEIDHVPPGRYIVQAGSGVKTQLAPEYHLSGGELLRSLVTVAPAAQHPETWVPDVVVASGQVTRLDIALSAGAHVQGRVRDTTGAPVADAKVQLTRVARWPAPDINGSSITSSNETVITAKGSGDGKGETLLHRKAGDTTTDAQGQYAFAGLPAGEHLLVVSDTSSRLAAQDRTLQLRGDEQLDGVDFVLPLGLTLRSRVVDPAGRPLAGASVYLRERGSNTLSSADLRTRTGDDGTFEVSGLLAGPMQISIALDGYAWFWGEVDAAAPPPRYVLEPAPRLFGVVTDAASGEFIEAFAVELAFEGSVMITGTDAHTEGRFDHDVPGDHRCKVTVTAPGYEPQTIEDILPSATAVAPVRFDLVRKP